MLLPAGADTRTDPFDDLTDDDLATIYAYPVERPWLRLNFVASLDGAIADAAGHPRGLTTPADQRVFALLRGLADVILVGAGTARSEQYAPVQPSEIDVALRARLGLAPLPPIAVVSNSLEIPDSLLVDPPDGSGRTIVVTTSATAVGRRRDIGAHADVLVCGSDRVDPVAVRRALAARGLGRIQAEGGPRLTRDLAAAGVLDELCLTLSPLLLAGGSSRLAAGAELDAPVHLRLGHVLAADDELLLRYVREGA